MFKTKRFLCIALALVMCLGLLLTGCSQKSNEESAKPDIGSSITDKDKGQEGSSEDVQSSAKVSDKPVTFTMLYSDNASYQLKEDWLVLEEIKRLTNVTLEPIKVPESDYATKRQIIINSGNMPDIITKTFASDVSEYALEGLFLPISDYLDKMPNFKKFLEEYGYDKEISNMKEADGKFYGLPVKADPVKYNLHQWLIRTDLFEKHNIPIPETMNDIYEAGKILKEAYPDAYPITNRFGSANILSMIGPAFGTVAGWGMGYSGFHYDEEKDEWIFAPESDEYKAMLEYCNMLLKEGILDPEFTTLDSNVYEERVVNSETFILADWVGNELRYNKNGKEKDPDFNVQMIFPPKGPGGYAVGAAQKYEQSWVISGEVKNKDYFDTFIKFLDWLYTDEAAVVVTFGVEGKTCKVVDGKYVYNDDITSGKIDHSREYGLDNNCLCVRRHPDWFAASKGEYISGLFNKMEELDVIGDIEPKIRLSAEDREVEKMYSTVLSDYINQMTEKFIYGKESFDNWDNFVKECKAKGADKLGELYNRVWKQQTK